MNEEAEEFRLKVPQTGIDDFKKIRNGEYYYVDKSELISDIVDDKNEVYPFTRPRRFGKTLNLSMIDAFFNMKYKGNTWFDGLKVQEHENCMKLKNSFPVISISMKDPIVDTVKDFMDKIKVKITSVYGKFEYLKKSDKVPEYLREACFGVPVKELSRAELEASLLNLCEMIEIHHGVKPIVLIDEYDNPVNSSFNKDTMIIFYRF